MASRVLDPGGPWVFEDLPALDLPDDGRRYEVVDGHLVVTPPPSHVHQRVGSRLLVQLARSCPPEWETVYEFGLPLGTDGRVPDLAVVRAARPDRPGPYPWRADDVGLVVEIMSPSSRKTDLFAKPGEYAEAGIPLFWRVDLEPEVVLHAFRLTTSGYREVQTVRTSAPVPVPWGMTAVDVTALAAS